MSFERTALRLAAAMALANGYAAPWPTLAQDRVFDSRQDPLEGLTVGDRVPILVLYTDDDAGHTLSQNNGGPPFEHKVHLVIELSLGMAVPGEGDGPISLTLPQTEPELEAALDAFEVQVSRVLRDGLSTWGALLATCHRGIESWDSKRFIDRETNVRLAARQIIAHVRLPLEAEPEVITTGSSTAYIPEPLATVLTAVAGSDSPYAATATAIQDMLLANSPDRSILLPTLDRIRIVEAQSAAKNNANVAAGPRADGVAEADFSS